MKATRFRKSEAGFSLIEVLIAIAIVAISFLVTYGLIVQTIAQMSRVCGEMKATEIMSRMVGDVSTAIKANLTTSPIYGISLPTTSGGTLPADSAAPYYYFDISGNYLGKGNIVSATAAYRATLGIIKVSATPNNTYSIHVLVYWPANIDPTVGFPISADLVTQVSN